MGNPGRRPLATGAGFTLVELVLTVALLLLIAGAVGYSFNSARQGTQLEEGAGQLESLFRFARAQSASTGRCVRVSFVEAALAEATNAASPFPGVQVQWEPDPLTEPGKFVRLFEATPFADQLNDLVQFRPMSEVESPTGAFTSQPSFAAPAESGIVASGAMTESVSPGVAPIVFYPDGSSDSAELILMSLDEGDLRRLRLSLSGLTGTVRRKWLAAEGQPELPEGQNEDVELPGGAPTGAESKSP
jgi:type II secretory pathway pseudopilin PulG